MIDGWLVGVRLMDWMDGMIWGYHDGEVARADRLISGQVRMFFFLVFWNGLMAQESKIH